MNFKPFYVKNERLTLLQMADLWSIAQENGANPHLENLETALTCRYVGVDYDNDLIYSDDCEDFYGYTYDHEAVELTYEQSLLHIQGKPLGPLEDPLLTSLYNHNIIIQIELVGGSTRVKRVTQEHEPTGIDLEYFETTYGKNIYLDDFSSAIVINTFKTKR